MFASSPFETLERYDQNAVYATLEDGEQALIDSKRSQHEIISLDDSKTGKSERLRPETKWISTDVVEIDSDSEPIAPPRSTENTQDDEIEFVGMIPPPILLSSSDDENSEAESINSLSAQMDNMSVHNPDFLDQDTSFFGNLSEPQLIE